MRLFEQYFKMPLELDVWGNYVFDNAGQMVLQFNEDKTGWSDIDKQQEVIDTINSEPTHPPVLGKLAYDSVESCITEDKHHWIEIRGWGALTSAGGFNLTNKEAAEVQDSLAEYIIEKLTHKP